MLPVVSQKRLLKKRLSMICTAWKSVEGLFMLFARINPEKFVYVMGYAH